MQERQLSLYCYVAISPEAEIVHNPCAFHIFDTLRHILLIFGRNEEKDQ